MATVRKRGDKWQVQVRKAGRPPISRSFKHKSDAETWARQVENEIDRAPLGFDRAKLRTLTLSDLVSRYRDEITPKKRGAAVERYRLARLLSCELGPLSLENLTAEHVARYRDQRLREVGAEAVRRELGLVRHVLNIARREWSVPLLVNPVADVTLPNPSKARERRLDASEWARLLDASKGRRATWLSPMLQLSLATGMRRSELLSARWEDVDLSRRTLRLRLTKNGHSRTIPLSLDAVSILEALPRSNSGLLFTVTPNAVRLAWERLTAKAGLVDLHFHDLRHEAISRFFERGLSLAEVALISGHRDHRMLLRYTHLRAENLLAKLDGPAN